MSTLRSESGRSYRVRQLTPAPFVLADPCLDGWAGERPPFTLRPNRPPVRRHGVR